MAATQPTIDVTPKIFYEHLEATSVVGPSTQISITCSSKGVPEPEIELSTDSCRDISNCSSFMVLQRKREERNSTAKTVVWQITPRKSLRFYCEAKNNMTSNLTVSTVWTLFIDDTKTIHTYGGGISTKETVAGDTVVLSCFWLTSLSETLFWFKDNKNMGLKHEDEEISTDSTFGRKLVIPSIEMNESGIYSCKDSAMNTVREIEIIVKEPIPPKIMNIRRKETRHFAIGETFEFNCSASGIPRPRYTLYKNNKSMDVGLQENHFWKQSGVVVLSNLTKGAKYRCEANNRLGSDFITLNIVPRSFFEEMYSFVEDNSTKLFVGALVLSLILVGIYSCYCLKKLNMNKGNRSDCDGKLLVRPQHSLLPYNEKWEISKESIEFESLLGKGAFGSVHKALVKDIRIGEEYSTAAVKVARNVYDEGQIFALKSELKIMLHVGQHENIVTLLGACTKNALENGEIYLVFEYCEKGSIKDFLCKNRDSFSYQHHGLEFGTQSTDSLRQNESMNYVSMDSRQHLLDRNYSALSTPDSLLSNITTFTYVNSQNVLASTDCSDQEVYQLSYQDLLVWALQISSGMEYLAYKEVCLMKILKS